MRESVCVCVALWPLESLPSTNTSRTKGKAAKMANTHTLSLSLTRTHTQRYNTHSNLYLCTMLSFCPSRTSNWFPLSPPKHAPFCLSVCLFALFLCQSVCLSVCLSVCSHTRTNSVSFRPEKEEKAVSVCQLKCTCVCVSLSLCFCLLSTLFCQ